MNPEPVIVTGVSVEPATVEDGVIAMMAGTGFEVGGGFVGAVVPPPQPVINHIPRMKITRIIFAVDFRSIVAFKKIKADILSLKSPNQEGVSSGL
jgi:hypothetical protein